MNLPHIQFYVGDWRKDLGIQSLSYHHRGVWLELLLLMHCSEQRGKLVLNGEPISNGSLARLLGMTDADTRDAITVLIASGVASRDQNGALINRRMVREEELRQKRRDVGSKGGAKAAANREQTPDNDNDDGTGALEKVREFARGEGIGKGDADWFYWKGRGNGWTNGGKPILDWRATLRSWNKAGYLPSQKQSSNGQRQFEQRPKERAPVYPKVSATDFPPDLSPEQIAKNKEFAAEMVRKVKDGHRQTQSSQ